MERETVGEDIIEGQGTLEERYLLIHGQFSYGSRVKNNGIFSLLLEEDDRRFLKLELALVGDSQLEVSFDDGEFEEALLETAEDDDYQRTNLISGLKESLDGESIEEMFFLSKGSKEIEIKDILKEKMANLLQENIELDIYTKFIKKEELGNFYPDLALDSKGEGDIDIGSKGEEESFESEIKLNCLPIISPVRGIKSSKLKLGDELIVSLNEEERVIDNLTSLLEDDDGNIKGSIVNIEFNEELNRYNLLLRFRKNISGSLALDPELKVLVGDIAKKDIGDSVNKKTDNYRLIISAFVLVTIIFLLALIFIIF